MAITRLDERDLRFLEEKELQFRDYWLILRRRQWTIISIFLASVLILITAVYLQPDPKSLYEAAASLIIDPDIPAVVTLGGGQPAFGNYFWEPTDLNTQLGILNNNVMAERVITTLKLADPEKDPTGYEKVLKEYRKAVSIGPVPNTRIVKITARDSDSEKAEKLANTLADMYIDNNLQTKLTAARRAVSWLSEQIVDLKNKVKESQEALQKYQKQHELLSLDTASKVQSEKMADLNTMYVQAKEKRVEAETFLNELKKFQDRKSAVVVSNLPSLSSLNTELTNAEIELTKLQQTYKEKHPKIQQMEVKIGTLRDKLAKEVDSLFKAKEAEVAVLRARENALQESINQYKQETITTNTKAVEYAVLQREVTSNEELYNILLRQLKETSVMGGLEKNNIRVLERAKARDITPKLKRLQTILFGSALALVLSVALAFLREYFDRSIKTPDDIEYYLGLPVLGIVPKVVPDKNAPSLAEKEPSALAEGKFK